MQQNTIKRIIKPLLFFLLLVVIWSLIHPGFNSLFLQTLLPSQIIELWHSRPANTVLQVALWLAGAYLFNRLLTVFFWDSIVSRNIGAPAPKLIKDVSAIIIFLLSIIGITSFVFNLSVTGLVATSGAIGLIVAFALRNMILDIFVGLAVNIERPYRIGDYIKVRGVSRPEQDLEGLVTEINWRTTRLKSRDNSTHIFTNNVFSTMVVTNYMLPDPRTRRTQIFSLGYNIPSERAIRVLLAGVKSVIDQPEAQVLAEPTPKVQMLGINARGIEYWVRYWTIPQEGTTDFADHAVLESILFHLQKAGLPLAHPKQDTYITRMPNRRLENIPDNVQAELISRVELFRDLAKSDLQQLADSANQCLFHQGDMLIQQGATSGTSMFILVEGLLDVYIQNQGNAIKVAQLVPGQFFGEMSLLTGAIRSATIMASTDAVVYEITSANMTALFRRRPELLETISRVVASRKLHNSEALSKATSEEIERQTLDEAAKIMFRIKSFFKGVF